MSVNALLLDILVVLVFAKLAAELADRAGLPAVVGEIVAGVVIGPSVLGLVDANEVLETLAELGVILLLLEVGMEMDLADLRRVGRSAFGVATVGVAVPFAMGYVGGLALGLESGEAVFVGAALTATSVGITARVFGDLKALATVEARTVLGAAVVDDVMGLLILTVVTRVVTEGSVSFLDVASLTGIAVGFIVLSTVLGLRFAPVLFRNVARRSRSSGTLVAVALAFTLALAELAHAAQLAPIIGAFVAGLALARTHQAERVRRELAPVGHLFVPVFFLQIGINADITQFAKPAALLIGGVLLLIGIVGKLVSSAGMLREPGDRLLVGIGMIPRGEVGLIFATLGLREGVLGDDVYAALLLVVLATTLLTPPALRWRHRRLHATDGAADDVAEAVRAARRLAGDGNSADEASWAALAVGSGVRALDLDARREFIVLVSEVSPVAWRLLSNHGVLARALPELAEAVEVREHRTALDPLEAYLWPCHERLCADPAADVATRIAGLALDVTDGDLAVATTLAGSVARQLGLDADTAARIAADSELLGATARRPDGLDEVPVRSLAVHVASLEHLERLISLHRAANDERGDPRVEELSGLLRVVLEAPPEHAERSHDPERRRARVIAHLADAANPALLRLLDEAPSGYLVRHRPDEIARHLRLRARSVDRDEVLVEVVAQGDSRYSIDIVARDRLGLLAREARTLAEFRCDVERATVVTWPGDRAFASFEVVASAAPDSQMLARRVAALFVLPLSAPALDDVSIEWDDHGSPWHTRVRIRGVDRLGALAAITTAFAAARVSVHSATIEFDATGIADTFELSDARGAKLAPRVKAKVEVLLRSGAVASARGPRRVRA